MQEERHQKFPICNAICLGAIVPKPNNFKHQRGEFLVTSYICLASL